MRRISALVVIAVLSLTGCGTATSAHTAEAGQPASAGQRADLDFTGTTLDGGTFEGTSLEGKPAVIWFWAPWCPTCRAQIPNVTALADTYDGKVSVIAVGGLDSEQAIVDLAKQIPYVTHVVDDEGAVWRHFGVTAQSTYAVISADGDLVAEGYLDDGQLNDLVARLAA